MKKILTSKIFLVIVTAIICTSIGVYAGSQLNASDIKYIDSNDNETTVDVALNNLYTRANTPIADLINYASKNQLYAGARTAGIVKTIGLDKGDYFVISTMGHAWSTSTSESSTTGVSSDNANFSVTNGTCTRITGHYVRPFSTAASNSKYQATTIHTNIFKCHMTANGTVKYTTNSGDYTNCAQGVILESIKID